MKRFFKWAAIVVGSLLLLLIVVAGSLICWLKWAGERDWRQAEAELRSKGEKLTFEELIPPMPPASENFFADPLWAGYSDLVRRKNSDGVEELVQKLPNDELPLSCWQKVPLSAEELDALARLNWKSVSEETPRRISVYSDLLNRLYSEKNAERKKQAAALMLRIISPANEALIPN